MTTFTATGTDRTITGGDVRAAADTFVKHLWGEDAAVQAIRVETQTATAATYHITAGRQDGTPLGQLWVYEQT